MLKEVAGGITFPRGFKAAGVKAGIKKNGKEDVALIFSTVEANWAGRFTTNRFPAAPVIVSRAAVSRPTFQRILSSAREKIADSLINGKAITVEGGTFTRNICSVRCLDCNKVWLESFERMEAIKKGERACPDCGSSQVVCCKDHQGKFCRRNCWRHGRTE